MLHHDQPEAVARLIEEFLPADGAVLRHPSDASAGAAGAPRRRHRARRRADRLSDRLLLRAGLPSSATRKALERLRRVRGFDERHHLTLMCRDLSEIARYAIVDDARFRLLKRVTPGQLHLHPARRGARCRGALHASAAQDDRRAHSRAPGGARAARRARRADALRDAAAAGRRAAARPTRRRSASGSSTQLDLVIDAGSCGVEPSTVIDLTGDAPVVVRAGKGLARAVSAGRARLIKSRAQKMDVNSPRSDARHLRPPGAVRDHAARGGARLCRAAFRRHDGARAGPHQPQSAAPHRPRSARSSCRSLILVARRWRQQFAVRLGEAGAGELLGAAQAARSTWRWVAAAGPAANLRHGARLGARC